MHRILLIHPPADVTPLARSRRPKSEYPMMPMGLFTIADYLARNGVEVRLVNLALERILHPHADVHQLLKGYDADIAAVSLHWFVHTHGAIETARIVRAMLPNTKVVLGGFTSSFFAREILERYSFIDAVVVGEGEETLLELARGLEPERIRGVAYRDSGRVRFTGFRKPVDDLERYSFTCLKNYERWQLYVKCSPSGYTPTRKPSFWLAVARSCPLNCAYCGGGREGYRAAMGREEPVVRSPKRLADDVAVLAGEYGIKVVKLSHDPLIWGERYFVELMEEIAKRGIDAGAYWDLTYLPREELIKKALRAFEEGLCWGLSIETTNDRAREGVGRPYSLADIEGFLPLAQRYDVLLDGYFLVGLPWTTREDVERDMDYALKLMRLYRNVYVVPPFPYTMDPHAPMALRPGDYGVRKLCASIECYKKLARSEKWEDWIVHETADLRRRDIAELTLKFFKKLERAYGEGEFGENMARRYSFEHEGFVLTAQPW
ncbi:MAG: radical SAM protein [Thermofilaceae archaeon]